MEKRYAMGWKVEPRGYRAAVYVPCLNNRCPERMGLHCIDAKGAPIEEPYYLCQNPGCYYATNPVKPEDVRSPYITEDNKKRVRYKSNERVLPGEGETLVT